MTDAAAAPRKRPGSKDVLKALGRPKVLLVLLLGLGSGLPFFLTGNTLGLWLREEGVTLAAIGFLSWVGLAYSFKLLWAPIVDKVDAPLLGRLGRRRGWMALSQIVIAAALIAMALIGPEGGLVVFGAAALVVAFASATQDIVVDAWRIEAAEGDDEELALLTSAFQLGYRIGVLSTTSLILFVAAGVGWNTTYLIYGAVMFGALGATLAAREPVARAVTAAGPSLFSPRGLFDAVVGPFVAFLKTHGTLAILMLAAISLYRLPDFVLGPMTSPFYVDLDISKEQLGSVRLSFGLVGTFLGIAGAGLMALKFGFGRTLLFGAILGPGSNLAYTALAFHGQGGGWPLFATLFVENFSEGFAGAALVAYMSSLTSLGYTATQYALLSSFYSLLGKVLKGFSGQIVEGLQASFGLMPAYAIYFAGTAAVGIPALILCAVLNDITKRRKREAEAAEGAAPA